MNIIANQRDQRTDRIQRLGFGGDGGEVLEVHCQNHKTGHLLITN